MVLSRFWISMASIHAELYAMDQEWPQGISHEASQCSLKYEVGDILDKFLMSTMCNIKGLSHHQEYEAINPTIFAATLGLGDRIKKLVSSNFVGMLISVSVIFYTEDTYSCSSNKGYFWILKRRYSQEISNTQQKALRFMDLGLSNILSGVKVDVWLCFGLRHIMFLGYQKICK